MEEMAYSEWSERMDIAGTNHWLPAYGFQQPTQLQQALLQHQDSNDGGTVLIGGPQQQFLFLETIVEETSDDLRSESDRSGPAGWADSDSDTESVIHVPNNLDSRDPPDWSGSERDFAVPKKRRRRTTDQQDMDDDQDISGDLDVESASLSSRSSSLLQFECLEKHCEDVFRTSATSDPFHDSSQFPPPSPSVMSNFSFDSLESNRWRFSTSPDSLDEDNSDSESDAVSSDECASSDDTLQHSSWSSRSSFRSSNSRLKSFRSFDSLNLLQPQQHHHSLAELSQSLTNNSLHLHGHPAGQQDILSVTTDDLSTSVVTVAAHSPLETKDGATPEVASVVSNEASSISGGGTEPSVQAKPQRSAENLSEDSGFGDHCVPAGVTSSSVCARGGGTVGTIIEDEDLCSSYYSDSSAGSGSGGGGVASSETSEQEKHGGRETTTSTKRKMLKLNGEFELRERRGWDVDGAKFNSSCWQSAPSLLLGEEKRKRVMLPVYRRAPHSQHLHSVPDDLCLCQSEEEEEEEEEEVNATQSTDEQLNTHNMVTKFPAASSPNLMYGSQEECMKHSSTIRVPLKYSSAGSNNELDENVTPVAVPSKGVHFCPVVSEVSWRDSYSDEEPQEDNKGSNEMDRALCALEKGEDVTVPLKQTLLLQKIQIGLPIGPGSSERERLVMELKQQDAGDSCPVTPTTTEGHVTTSAVAVAPAPNETAVHVVSMETKQQKAVGCGLESGGESSRRDSDLSSGKKSRFGGFFHRFSLRRLSGRVVGNNGSSKKQKEKRMDAKSRGWDEKHPGAVTSVEYEDVTIIPLHPPPDDEAERKPAPDVVVSSKPPLPPLPPRSNVGNANKPIPSPRRRPDATTVPAMSGLQLQGKQDSTSMSRIDPPLGLLETDLDTDISTVRPHQNAAAPSSKKARSLLNLGAAAMLLKPPPGGNNTNRPLIPADSRARSMEFLLDKENQAAVQPPENELQKGGVGERVMSEHQLRVQRSLQKLNVPDWYKNSTVARGPEGFLLKRSSDGGQGWPGLCSKTTSLSSLGSTQSAAARSPTGHLLSPSPTPHMFTRWSTSRLNSGGTSTSTSPCGSTRSSFNYRQPYLGWRSQERLTRPRTPAERLAAGLLPTHQQQQQQLTSPQGIITPQQTQQDLHQLLQQEAELRQLQQEDEEQMQQVPNLSEVRTSIKEVTSAIVHYVSGVRDGSGEALAGDSHWDSLSLPRGTDLDVAVTPRGSPRGSSGRLCWLESSFVGTRPLDSPETPLTLTSDDVNKTLETLQQQQDGGMNVLRKLSGTAGPADLYLDLNSSQRLQNANTHIHHQVNGPEEPHMQHSELRNRPSPGSTTLEDVLDSLLGLPPTSRSPSPGAGSASPGHCRPSQPPPPLPPPQSHQHHNQRRSCGDLRSDLAGSASDDQPAVPDPPPYYVSDTLRRRSEGSTPRPSGSSRRVSFDMTTYCSGGQQQQQQQQQPKPDDSSVVRCRYSKCGRTASVAEARRTFKTCHNCSHVYCSRECRRAHWERHRKTCLHSRVGALCRQVLATAREDPATLRHLSLLARRGYLAQGRGAVKSFFSSPELAERFVANGFADLGEPAFVCWADLLPGEMGADLYSELLRLCKSYKPDTRFVLYVAVCVVSEVPTSGAVKWERQLVSRCAKLRLCRSLMPIAPPQATSGPQRRVSPCNITRDSENPETLILTSLPGCQGQMAPQRAREISFTNIQRHLRQRGVSLRRHFPDVYKRLCAYVEGSTERFAPVTVYPRDAVTGKSFMCIIMPDAEPEKLELVPRDSSRVQTIDISLEHEVT